MGDRAFLAKVYVFRVLDGFVLIYPLYTVMFVQRGLSPALVAGALMAWSIVGFILQIPSGVLADRWSRRWLLAGAQLVRGAGFLTWLLFPGVVGVMVGMMLWGVKSAFTNGTFEALVYDELHAEGRAEDYPRVIGRAQGAMSAAVLATSLTAAVLVPLGYAVILQASAATAVLAAAAALALPRARKTLRVARPHYLAHLASGFAAVARDPLVIGLIAFAALSQGFGGGLEGFWPIFGGKAGLPAAGIALFVAAISGAQVLGAVFAHRAGSRGGAARFYGLFGLAGVLLAIAAAAFRPWTTALAVLIAGLFKVVDINFDAQLQNAIPADNRATIGSVKSFAGQVTMTALLGAFGLAADWTSYRGAFLGAGAALVVVAVAYGLAGLRRRV